jgi:GntR family transcriptional regulator/MocR family aminotransferase
VNPTVWPEIALGPRPDGATLSGWLCDEIRRAILEGRLRLGARLPGTREFARLYHVSRRTAVAVFDHLRAEGYLTIVHGSGARVNEQAPDDLLVAAPGMRAPNAAPSDDVIPLFRRPARPFRAIEPALAEFPAELWARVASRRLRRISTAVLAGGGIAGYKPLREAVAAYLGASRGVTCAPEQVIIVSGVQQALDLIGPALLRPGDKVWMEDPGYTGAVDAFRRTGAEIVPVRVDADGFDPRLAATLARRARAIYVTPAHQFVLGATMPLERRLALLSLARASGAYIIEDDYDSEFRFEGRPVPALQGLDRTGCVLYTGTFNKVLFPALRLGYLVALPPLVDSLLKLRYQMDRYPPGLSQAILCDFIVEGHFGRHLRRMRELYTTRLAALRTHVERHLSGAIEIPRIEAGLHTPAYLKNGVRASRACERAAAVGLETMALDRFAIRRRDLNGLLLGFAAFSENEIRDGVAKLAAALEAC